jgi:hypothetical protein
MTLRRWRVHSQVGSFSCDQDLFRRGNLLARAMANHEAQMRDEAQGSNRKTGQL